jgi:SAM-dependent methyltransferase
MPLTPDLKFRNLVPELMDDPNLPAADHQLALKGLRRINRFSGTVSHLASQILKLARRRPQPHWTILDIGCANGENLMQLHKMLDQHISVSCIGWDISPYSIQSAKELADSLGLSTDQVRFEIVDALATPEPLTQASANAGSVKPIADIVMNSLFMHHFDEPSVVQLLTQSSKLAKVAVLADDLHRTAVGWILAKLGCWILSRSPVVHFDGPQSVRAAFSSAEIMELAKQAGLHDCQLVRHWPERYTLCWERPSIPS